MFLNLNEKSNTLIKIRAYEVQRMNCLLTLSLNYIADLRD